MNAPLKTEFLPPPTRALFERLTGEALLENMLLVGGSALALQIGHRLSVDLDFACLEPKLPAARARSRDLFDLMVLIRDHGFTIDEAFRLAGILAPIEKRDIERHKAVMTGVISLDTEDEGFESIALAIGIEEIYAFFASEVDRYERDVARAVFLRK